MIKIKVVACIVLIFVVFMLYGPFLHNPLVFDDTPFFDDDFGRYVDEFPVVEPRSVALTTLAVSAQWFGLDVWHFRLENLILHISVVIIIFVFLQQLYRFVLPEEVRSSERKKRICIFLIMALIFALHPVNVYGVGYLMQRTIVMATLFSLLSMLCFMHGFIKLNKLWLWLSVLLYSLALFSKEHVVMLPLVLLCLAVLLNSNWLYKIKRSWYIWLTYVVLSMLAVLARKNMIASVYEPQLVHFVVGEEKSAFILSILTQTAMYFKYWLIWFLPNPEWMSIDIRIQQATQYGELRYWLSAGVFLLYGLFAFYLLKRRGKLGLLGFALIFPWLMFMTELSTVRIQEPFVLYRGYIWMIGLCILLPIMLLNISLRLVLLVAPAILTALFVISLDRLATFSHPVLLWEDARKIVDNNSGLPGSYRIYNNLGFEYLQIMELQSARLVLNKAISLAPDTPYLYENIGIAYAKSGLLDQALLSFNKAIELKAVKYQKSDIKHYLGRAKVYEQFGAIKEATADYEFTCKLASVGCTKAKIIAEQKK